MICAVIYTGVQVVHQSVDLEEESEMEIEEVVIAKIATGKDLETGTLIIVVKEVMVLVAETAETEETVIEIVIETGIEIKIAIDTVIGLETATETEMSQEQEKAMTTSIDSGDVKTGTEAKRGRAVGGSVEAETIKEMLIQTKSVREIEMVKDVKRATVVVVKIKKKMIIRTPPGPEVGRRAWVAGL